MASQQLGYPQLIQGSQQLIYFTLFDHVDDLINGWCTQSNQHLGPKGSWILYDQNYLILVIAFQPFYLNPYKT